MLKTILSILIGYAVLGTVMFVAFRPASAASISGCMQYADGSGQVCDWSITQEDWDALNLANPGNEYVYCYSSSVENNCGTCSQSSTIRAWGGAQSGQCVIPNEAVGDLTQNMCPDNIDNYVLHLGDGYAGGQGNLPTDASMAGACFDGCAAAAAATTDGSFAAEHPSSVGFLVCLLVMLVVAAAVYSI